MRKTERHWPTVCCRKIEALIFQYDDPNKNAFQSEYETTVPADLAINF